jgi:hypothetical protein
MWKGRPRRRRWYDIFFYDHEWGRSCITRRPDIPPYYAKNRGATRQRRDYEMGYDHLQVASGVGEAGGSLEEGEDEGEEEGEAEDVCDVGRRSRDAENETSAALVARHSIAQRSTFMTKPKPKRKAKDVAIANSADPVDLPDGWIDKFLALKPEDQTSVIVDLANRAQITTAAIKKARPNLPSFSAAKWNDFPQSFGLPEDLALVKFDSFSITAYYLPPSFHVAAFQVAWHFQDVYQERPEQDREEARIRIFDAVRPVPAEFRSHIDHHLS